MKLHMLQIRWIYTYKVLHCKFSQIYKSKGSHAIAFCKMGYEMKLASYKLNAFMNFRMRILLYFVVVQLRILRKPFHLK